MRRFTCLLVVGCLGGGAPAWSAATPGNPPPGSSPGPAGTAQTRQEQTPAATAAEAGPVAARVNGEPIYRREVDAGMPKPGLFGAMFSRDTEQLKQVKLERLIRARVLKQFLRAQRIEVTAAEIEGQVEQLRQTPPASGCSCCRYKSLEEFMDTFGIDLAELRAGITNDLGVERYLSTRWDQEYPAGGKRDDLLRTERLRLEQEYVRASHIFFNTFQDPRFAAEPETVRREAGEKAERAWARLKAGEAFEAVARAVSEDANSKPEGGALGCIPPSAFGPQFASEVQALRPGQYGRPVESAWGFHIIRRESLADADLLGILRQDYAGRWWAGEQQQLQEQAKVERADAP